MPRTTKAERELARIRQQWQEADHAMRIGKIGTPWSVEEGRDLMTNAEHKRRQYAAVEAELAQHNNEMWAAMAPHAIALGLPRHYRGDLLIDLAYTRGDYGPVPDLFAWHLRDCGTNLLYPAIFSHRHQDGITAASTTRTFSGTTAESHWFLWANGRLQPSTPERIDATMAHHLDRQWAAERQAKEDAEAAYQKLLHSFRTTSQAAD